MTIFVSYLENLAKTDIVNNGQKWSLCPGGCNDYFCQLFGEKQKLTSSIMVKNGRYVLGDATTIFVSYLDKSKN